MALNRQGSEISPNEQNMTYTTLPLRVSHIKELLLNIVK
jgi:hypothetical protein